ncbi:MAG: hypothetical protein ABW026_09590 [Microvirga sp.]|uniref:hypothetical protein n=1 Tax=Methylobacterium sp. J-059 TaxID=2836643 RepID=UPI001FBB78CD|nr:hypothetical protein [Methylobacterium sp. J-059]MCJ2039007.1 hypothetical protein [Methylobacterium sp. J-059]
MRVRIPVLVAISLILAPAAASAQYYGGDFDRRGDVHVDRYHHGDHDDVVIHRPHRDYGDRAFYGERGFYGERRHHHHHHDDY